MTKIRDVSLRGAVFATKQSFKKVASVAALLRNDTLINAFVSVICCIFLCGCHATSGAAKHDDLNTLVRDLRKDKQAQSAVETLTNTLSGRPSDVKYCPVDGQRFSGKIQICPVHTVELKTVED